MKLEQINTTIFESRKPIVIINNYEIENSEKEKIINKVNELNYQYIDLSLAMQLKIIESCDEIVQNECNKLDGNIYKKPLIITNNQNEILQDNITDIYNIIDITIYMLKTKLLNLDKDTPIIVLSNSEIENDKIICLSIEELLLLENICTVENNYDLALFDTVEVNFSAIIPTYINIMKSNLKYEVEENENIVRLINKKHTLSFKFVSDITELELDSISEVDIIIEGIYDRESISILNNNKINEIYNIIKKPGEYFRG